MNRSVLIKPYVNVYPRTKFPRRALNRDGTQAEHFSVTVLVVNCGDDPKDPLMNLGYYNYDMECWLFHTDTLIDMKDVNFIWCYVPTKMFEIASKESPDFNP